MIDYDFIKKLLKVIAESESFCVNVQEISEKLKKRYPNMDTDAFENTFYKVLFLLKDCGVVEEMAGRSLGFKVDVFGNVQYTDSVVRLTAAGYGFYDNICKNGFFSKVKDVALSVAVEFSKALIAKSAESLL